MPQHVPPRIYRRVPFETAVRLRFDRFHGFVEQYSANLSLGGMFIHSEEPPPLGAEVTVEFRLEDGFELIRGRGRVVWVHRSDEGGEPSGFGLRFLELTPGSRELIFRLVERRVREGDRVFDLEEEAPATAAGRLLHDEDRLASPPWERPVPRAGEEAAAWAGAAPGAARGAEVARFGRAAREAAEAEAASGRGTESIATEETDEVEAGRMRNGEVEAGGTAPGGVEPGTIEAGVEAEIGAGRVEAGDEAEIGAGRVGSEVGAATPGTGEARESEAAETGVREGEAAEALALELGALAAGAAEAGAGVAARATPAAGGDPDASFAGLVEDDEETSDGAAGEAAGPAPFAATDPPGREPLGPAPAGDRAEEWPPRDWREAAAPVEEGEEGEEAGFTLGDERTGAETAADPWVPGSRQGLAEVLAAPGATGGSVGAAPAEEAEPSAGALAGEREPAPGAPRSPWSGPRPAAGEGGEQAVPPWGGDLGAASATAEAAAAGGATSRPARVRRGWLAGAIAAGVVVLVATGFLLFRLAAEPGADAAAPGGGGAAAGERAAASPADPLSPADPAAAADLEPGPATAGGPAATSPPSAGPAAEPPPEAAAPATGPSTIERIAWERRDGGLDFEIAGGRPIAPVVVDHFTVGGDRPRLVVRIAGIERPYAGGDVAVGGPLVERVRTGFHPGPAGGPGSLHVVFDLVPPAAAAGVETSGGRVRVRFEAR